MYYLIFLWLSVLGYIKGNNINVRLANHLKRESLIFMLENWLMNWLRVYSVIFWFFVLYLGLTTRTLLIFNSDMLLLISGSVSDKNSSKKVLKGKRWRSLSTSFVGLVLTEIVSIMWFILVFFTLDVIKKCSPNCCLSLVLILIPIETSNDNIRMNQPWLPLWSDFADIGLNSEFFRRSGLKRLWIWTFFSINKTSVLGISHFIWFLAKIKNEQLGG